MLHSEYQSFSDLDNEDSVGVQFSATTEKRHMSSPLLSKSRSTTYPENGQFGSLSRSPSSDLMSCPSCRGLGQVPKESQEELVALIPMKDNRLKPRRTICYVGLAVILCLVAAGLLVFFFLPRDITLSSNNPFLESQKVNINATTNTVSVYVLYQVNVTNKNYVAVTISGVSLSARYYDTLLGTAITNKNETSSVALRSTATLAIPIKVVFVGKQGATFVTRCQDPYPWNYKFRLDFVVTVNYTLLSQTSQSSLSTNQRTSCKPPLIPFTTKSTTASTTTVP